MKSIISKMGKVLLILGVLVTSISILPLLNVEAEEGAPGIKFQQPDGVMLVQDGNSIVYKKLIENVETEIGRVKISYKNPTNNNGFVEKTPEEQNGNKVVQLPTFESFEIEQGSDIVDYEAKISFIPATGYEIRSNPKLGDETVMLPGAEEGVYQREINLQIKSDGIIQYGNSDEIVTGMQPLSDVSFVLIGSSDNENDLNPMMPFPIFARLSGVESLIFAEENTIILPDDWTSGEIEFYAKIFTRDDGVVEPYEGQTIGGVQSEVRVDVEGIVDNAHGTAAVTGIKEEHSNKAVLGPKFLTYGRATYHIAIVKEDFIVSQMIRIMSSDYIGVKASSPMPMAFSFGSEPETQTGLTGTDTGTVKIFFGNTETTLIPMGPKVGVIKSVTGAERVVLNADGTATITLPNISEETTTLVTIEFKMSDNTVVTKKLNIARTAITLNYSDAEGKKTLYAGYVANKQYLYNNLSHDESGFDAYLQVILYKDNTVVGYRQVQVDDKELIDNLFEGGTNAIESFDHKKATAIAGDGTDFDISDVNGASVFLTNGPIDYDSETLPSIEFGIGAGVKITWEAR